MEDKIKYEEVQPLKIVLDIFRRIFVENWERFKAIHCRFNTDYINEVVGKMLNCGKEEGGYCEYICFGCGQDVRRVAFTCKSSFCLSCSKVYTDNFISQVSKVLQPGVVYRHVVLTVPEEQRIFFFRDREGKLLSEFMRCGDDCLEAAVSKAVRTKVKVGAITVFQTHGRDGHYNPHLHVIMTSGGIDEATGKWVELKYFPYEILHRKWQYHLFKMLKEQVPTAEMKSLIDMLWKKFPHGLVAYITKGNVPQRFRGLAKYLAKYVASPPIAISRIIRYTGREVTYCYNDHKTKRKETITVDVMTFIGRMVQHILPKGFQRIRYYGLQATKTFKKWVDAIKEGLEKVGRDIRDAYQVVAFKKYRERYQEMSGHDPLVCRFCGRILDLWKIWHPKYGTIYDECKELKAGKYEKTVSGKDPPTAGDGRCSLRPCAGGIQLPLLPVWV